MIPSRCGGALAASRADLACDVVGGLPVLAFEAKGREVRTTLRVGLAGERVPVEPDHVEDHVRHRAGLREARGHCLGEAMCMRCCRAAKLGRPLASKQTTSPSRTTLCEPSAPLRPASSG